jgi:mRNA interferase MazF
MKRGEVWLVDLGEPTGREQAFQRPAIIVQSNDVSLGTVVIIPCTTKVTSAQGRFATSVNLPASEGGLSAPTLALCHQIRALDQRKLIRKLIWKDRLSSGL